MSTAMSQECNIEISRQDANQLIPSVESAYYGLLLKGYYLPKLTSSIITADYLLGILFEKLFVPKQSDIVMGQLIRSVKKYEILEELKSVNLNQKGWGMDEKHQPDKQWAVNVLKTLKPNHQFFKKYSPEKFDMKKFTTDQIAKIKELDYSCVRKTQVKRFFRIDKEKIKKKRELEKEKRLQKRINRKMIKIQGIEEEIIEMKQKIE